MFSLFINNKHGSLVYQRNFTAAVQLSANDSIRLASTFHGLSAIAAQLSPVASPPIPALSSSSSPDRTNNSSSGPSFGFLQPRGINFIEAENFKLQCLETLTGLKFVLVTELTVSTVTVDSLLRRVYEAYSDYVLKNPFYDLDMPIRCQLFDREIEDIFSDYITV